MRRAKNGGALSRRSGPAKRASTTTGRTTGSTASKGRRRLVHSAHNPLGRRALARGSYCVIGDPDAVVREFSRLRSAGLDGLAINFVDYLGELPYFSAEVLPRLEKVGLRTKS